MFGFCNTEMLPKCLFNMRSLVFWDFVPFGPTLGIPFEVSHRNIKMVYTHTGTRTRFVFDVLNPFEYHPFCAFNVVMLKLVLKAQRRTEAARIKIMWREAIIAHTR